MFENNIFAEDSFEVMREDDKVIGFTLKTLITYYRGIPLSMVDSIRVYVNDVEVPQENIGFSLDDEDEFTLEELTTVSRIKWEYGDYAKVSVYLDEPLKPGKYEIKLEEFIRTAYIPVPVGGFATREVVVTEN